MERGPLLLVATMVVFVALVIPNEAQVNVTRAGCGVTALCVDTPGDCDPAGNKSCLFASVVAGPPGAPNATALSIKLRGNSLGYVALGLTANASEGTTELFICAQNSSANGTFFFRTMQRNNTNAVLTPEMMRATQTRGLVEGDVIKCEFSVNATNTRSSSHDATTFSVLLGTGRLVNDTLGPFNISLNSGPLNISDPSSNVARTTLAPTTHAPTTPSGASSVLLPHALLLLPSVLTLSVTQRA